MVELYKFINSGLSETDDQTLFAKWVRVVKYLYSRGNMGIATVRAGIDMMISVDVSLNICYNAGIVRSSSLILIFEGLLTIT